MFDPEIIKRLKASHARLEGVLKNPDSHSGDDEIDAATDVCEALRIFFQSLVPPLAVQG